MKRFGAGSHLIKKNDLWAASALLLFSRVVFAANAITVTAPCGANGFRSCDQLFNGTGYVNGDTQIAASVNGAVALKVPGVNTLLPARIQQQVDCYYNGVELNTVGATLPANQCPGAQSAPLVCDPVPSPFNGNMAEILANHSTSGNYSTPHNSQSCGTPANILVNVKVNSEIAGIPTNITLSSQTTLASTNSREFAYVAGAFVAAESCFYQQIYNQINAQAHTLTIQPQSSCYAFAQTYMSNSNSLLGMYGNEIQNQKNISDVLNCQNDWTTRPTPNPANLSLSGGVDAGELRQSAQAICHARNDLEQAYVNLVACEIFSESEAAYVHQLGSTSQVIANLLNPLNDVTNPKSLNSVCSAQCKNSKSLAQVNSCANACYNSQLGPFVQAIIQSLWPSPPTSTQGCTSSAKDPGVPITLFLGSLGQLVSGYSRRKKSRKKKNSRIFIFLFPLIAIFLFTACSTGSGPVPTSLVVPNNCSAGPLSNYTSSSSIPCVPSNPGTGGLASTVATGSSNLTSAAGSLGTSGSLTSGANGNNLANSPVTTAAATPPNTYSPSVAATPPNSGSSGSTGSSSAGGSSGATGSDVGTPSLAREASVSGSADPSGQGDALYSEGGSGSGGSGGGSAGGGGASALSGLVNAFGGGGAEGSGSAHGSGSDLGRGLASVPPSASLDPTDYFGRINANSNLFTVVTTRYRTQAMQWALQGARASTLVPVSAQH